MGGSGERCRGVERGDEVGGGYDPQGPELFEVMQSEEVMHQRAIKVVQQRDAAEPLEPELLGGSNLPRACEPARNPSPELVLLVTADEMRVVLNPGLPALRLGHQHELKRCFGD